MAAVPNFPNRGNFTRDDVLRMEEQGILTGRWELLEGELIDKMGQNPPHARTLGRVFTRLRLVFGEDRVRNQAPIEIAQTDRPRNEPQPDIAVVAEDKLEYDQRHPRGDELILIVEVSDSSSRFDLTTKAALYARAGVPQYWVLDVPGRKLIIHGNPQQGTYTQREELNENDQAALAESTIRVSEFLPPITAQQ